MALVFLGRGIDYIFSGGFAADAVLRAESRRTAFSRNNEDRNEQSPGFEVAGTRGAPAKGLPAHRGNPVGRRLLPFRQIE